VPDDTGVLPPEFFVPFCLRLALGLCRPLCLGSSFLRQDPAGVFNGVAPARWRTVWARNSDLVARAERQLLPPWFFFFLFFFLRPIKSAVALFDQRRASLHLALAIF